MDRRHATLNARALATLLQPNDRVSKISDGYGDFCLAPASVPAFHRESWNFTLGHRLNVINHDCHGENGTGSNDFNLQDTTSHQLRFVASPSP